MSISKEAIEAAARAAHQARWPGMSWDDDHQISDSGRDRYRREATAALTAAAPFIQAAALREAAVDLCSEKCGDNYAPDYCETCRAVEALHARADQLEGKTK